MQELDSFNEQESLNPALMLPLGVGAIPIAVTLHGILLLPWTWCINATDGPISEHRLPLVHDMSQRRNKKNQVWWKTLSQPHQDRQTSVQKVKPTHLCDILLAQVQHRGESPKAHAKSLSCCAWTDLTLPLCLQNATGALTTAGNLLVSAGITGHSLCLSYEDGEGSKGAIQGVAEVTWLV